MQSYVCEFGMPIWTNNKHEKDRTKTYRVSLSSVWELQTNPMARSSRSRKWNRETNGDEWCDERFKYILVYFVVPTKMRQVIIVLVSAVMFNQFAKGNSHVKFIGQNYVLLQKSFPDHNFLILPASLIRYIKENVNINVQITLKTKQKDRHAIHRGWEREREREREILSSL